MIAAAHPSRTFPETPPAVAGLDLADLESAVFEGRPSLALETLPQTEPIDRTFETSLRIALDKLGGAVLFDMELDNVEDCQRVAAVRLGDGEERQFALVIMPRGGGSIRVESTENSENPLAAIAESYDNLMMAMKAAA